MREISHLLQTFVRNIQTPEITRPGNNQIARSVYRHAIGVWNLAISRQLQQSKSVCQFDPVGHVLLGKQRRRVLGKCQTSQQNRKQIQARSASECIWQGVKIHSLARRACIVRRRVCTIETDLAMFEQLQLAAFLSRYATLLTTFSEGFTAVIIATAIKLTTIAGTNQVAGTFSPSAGNHDS